MRRSAKWLKFSPPLGNPPKKRVCSVKQVTFTDDRPFKILNEKKRQSVKNYPMLNFYRLFLSQVIYDNHSLYVYVYVYTYTYIYIYIYMYIHTYIKIHIYNCTNYPIHIYIYIYIYIYVYIHTKNDYHK